MSTNISKQKRDDLLNKIREIRTYIASAKQDDNTARLLSYLSELEKDVNGKKYGLVFEEHREEIDEVLDTHTPVLSEEKDLFIDNGGKMNFLIEGDNLASLKLLEKTHKGRVDLIYIDPPYNTGNQDFIYDDTFVDKTDLFRHSKWISFIANRLQIAKKLLSTKGSIFISIDNNEQSHLKILCDEIFGSENFVDMISWFKKASPSNDAQYFSNDIEYILIYARDKKVWRPYRLPLTDKQMKYYQNPDNDPRGVWNSATYTCNKTKEQRPSLYYPIVNPHTGKEVWPKETAVWAYSKEQCQSHIEDGLLFWGVDGTAKFPRFKKFLTNHQGVVNRTLWHYDDVNHTQGASGELKSLGITGFATPKPTRLIDRIIRIATDTDSIILDFFAGSGTTGHAVLNFNAEHEDSNRRFILCTNNENNICREVTYERIKRVIDKEGYVASLKYYKVDYIPISDRMYYEYADELLAHIRELVELENGVNFRGNDKIGIVLTEEELDDFISQLENNTKYQKLYLGHDILMDSQQAQMLKNRKISINIIPDYYYKELEG